MYIYLKKHSSAYSCYIFIINLYWGVWERRGGGWSICGTTSVLVFSWTYSLYTRGAYIWSFIVFCVSILMGLYMGVLYLEFYSILQLVNQFFKSFKNNMYTLSVFIHLSKAFDAFNHSIILKRFRGSIMRPIMSEDYNNLFFSNSDIPVLFVTVKSQLKSTSGTLLINSFLTSQKEGIHFSIKLVKKTTYH